jgi:hypothetical protein
MKGKVRKGNAMQENTRHGMAWHVKENHDLKRKVKASMESK